jgi:hypothetical protein
LSFHSPPCFLILRIRFRLDQPLRHRCLASSPVAS